MRRSLCWVSLGLAAALGAGCTAHSSEPHDAGVRRDHDAGATVASGMDAAGAAYADAQLAADAGIPMSSDAGTTPRFVTRTLTADYYAEGAAVGDIDGDDRLDLIAGPHWYAAPNFELGGTLIANPTKLTLDELGAFFLEFAGDVNADGRTDVIVVGNPGGGDGAGTPNCYWYENPGRDKLVEPWPKHRVIDSPVAGESPGYLNVTGDAAPELVFMSNDRLGYARPGDPASDDWLFTAISPNQNLGGAYVHGLGVGDVDGDGLLDMLERTGYWLQRATTPWERHELTFWTGDTARAPNWGGAQMYAYDIDGDGDSDVVSVLAAHQYGLAWFEQRAPGNFVAHEILPTQPGPDNTSQLHAMVVADVNADGLLDLVTGKRYYAHPSTAPDPGTTDPARLIWLELQRTAAGVKFVPHTIHEDSGVGLSFVVRDLTGDGKLDIFTANKRGTFLHIQQ